MSLSVTVVFEDNSSSLFTVTCSRDSFVCVLKRCIESSTGISPLEQRLSLVSKIDNFEYPSKIRCTKRKRNIDRSIVINGSNEDSYKLDIDSLNDNILDVKFLLGKIINEKAEFIYLQHNNIPLSNDLLVKDTNLLTNKNENIQTVFWLEYPSNKEGHSNIYRTVPRLSNIDAEWPTIARCIRKQGKENPTLEHLGIREYLENGKRGKYVYLTFKEINDRVSNIAAGYCTLGLKPKTKLGIISENRIEWSLCDYAGHCQSFITVPLYETLSKDAAKYIINHAEVSIVICSKNKLEAISGIRNVCPTLKYIIVMDDTLPDKNWVKSHNNNKIKYGYTHLLSELEQIGKNNINNYNDHLPAPDDLATIMYTSGTTGKPKGVMTTHRNMLSTAMAWKARTPETHLSGNDDKIISFLPLAHSYERQVELLTLIYGARVGYWCNDKTTLIEDVQELKPTFFGGVPRIYQTIQDKVLSTVESGSFIKRYLFNKAYNSALQSLENNEAISPFWNKLVFSKVKERFGGNIKGCTSGSAPLSVSTGKFLNICFSDDVGEGYGLTESASSGTTTAFKDTTRGHVGTPVSCIEIKLVSVPDMNYLVTDKPYPRGEILLRGPSIFKGYYKNNIKTSEVLGNDGWFCTGDIGVWLSNGKLKIVDRKKNIFKLQQGEYIRPEYIENVYKMSPYIASCFVYGDSNKNYLVSIIVPDFEVIGEWSKKNGLTNISDNLDELVKHPKIVNLIRLDMDRIGTREKLFGFEKAKRFKIIKEDFTIENGLLTATMKLKRHQCKLRFKNEIEQLYKTVAVSRYN